jgi:hypothetical protein
VSVSIDFRSRLYDALNVTGITSLIDEYESQPALIYGTVIPEDCLVSKTINYYLSTPIDCTAFNPVGKFSVNCRAETESESYSIAYAVITNINMVSFGDYYITCQWLQTLPPQDPTDNFNSPIEITFKQR